MPATSILTDWDDRLNVTFIDKDGTEVKFQVAEGDNLLDIAQANDLEMEGESSRGDDNVFSRLLILRACQVPAEARVPVPPAM